MSSIVDVWWYLYWRFRTWRERPRYVRVGNTVCCCDLQHRMIVEIDVDMVVMSDGRTCSVPQCVEEVQLDGTCHTKYETETTR